MTRKIGERGTATVIVTGVQVQVMTSHGIQVTPDSDAMIMMVFRVHVESTAMPVQAASHPADQRVKIARTLHDSTALAVSR